MANHRYRLEIISMNPLLDHNLLTLFPQLRCIAYSEFYRIDAFERSEPFVLSSELTWLNKWVDGGTIIHYEHREVECEQ